MKRLIAFSKVYNDGLGLVMGNAGPTTFRELDRARGTPLDLCAEYQPDNEAQARALLLILGITLEEIERIIAEINLEWDCEM